MTESGSSGVVPGEPLSSLLELAATQVRVLFLPAIGRQLLRSTLIYKGLSVFIH